MVIKTVQKPHHPFLKLVILVMKTEPESLFSFVVFGKLSRDNVFTLFIFFTNINILFSKQLIASPGCRAFLRRREAAGVLIVWLLPSVGSRGVGQDRPKRLSSSGAALLFMSHSLPLISRDPSFLLHITQIHLLFFFFLTAPCCQNPHPDTLFLITSISSHLIDVITHL